jgi:hypothetical protein
MYTTTEIFGKAEQIYFNNNRDKVAIEGPVIANFLLYKDKKSQTPISKLPAGFKAILDSLLKANDIVPIEKFQNFRDSINNMYKVASSLLQQTSLWTIGSQFTANQQQLFNKTNFNSEYLKGITKNNTSMGLELDIKANINIYDTTAVGQTYKRKMLVSSAGINWIIYKDKTTQKSYVEFAPAITYNNIFSGLITGETKSKFTGNGTLRFRVSDSLWVPIAIQYDPQSGKFFGFLNITSNFDWLGANKATSSAN